MIGGFWLFTGGDLEHGVGEDEIGIWVAMVIVPAVVLVARLFTGLADKGIGAAEAEAAALGFRVVELPEVGLASRPGGGARATAGGAAEMTGERHGRAVDVRLDGGDSVVVLHASAPSFELAEADGKLSASSGAPAAVVGVVRSLRQAKRWRGIALRAVGDTVTIERHGAVADGWLYDLWLGERLLEEIAAGAQYHRPG